MPARDLPITTEIARRAGSRPLSTGEVTRFSRHLLLPEVGGAGQRALLEARVLIIGAGGLGSPAALYLAAAGVGTLGLIDFDRVDASNLQRQILFADKDVGRLKVEAARDRLLAANPATRVETHAEALTAANAARLIEQYDLVVDGTDNFATRYLANDACVLAGKPYVYGSIYRFDGQVTVFYPPHGPCYRCLFPTPPAPGKVPSCAEGGVLGVLPGAIGVAQATEAIKLILGVGEPLLGRLHTFDALDGRHDDLRFGRDPACRVCGDTPDIRTVGDEGAACAARVPLDVAGADEVSPEALRAMLAEDRGLQLIDVRGPEEAAICRIDGSRLIALGALESLAAELPRDRPIVVYCKSGRRGRQALATLRRLGFPAPLNLNGGILAWIDRCQPDLPKY